MPKNDDTPITIGGILEMTPGDKDNPVWINQPFSGTVEGLTNRQTKTGTAMFTGSLADPDTGATIAFSCFGRKVFPPNGSLVECSGQGISLGEYNGTPQITIGQKAVVGKIADAPARQAQAPARQSAPASRPASSPQGGAYFGATVGMAVNNGCTIALKSCEAGALEPGSLEFWNSVYNHASRILRMSAVLEAGQLAPKPGTSREPDPEPEAPPPRRQPEPPAERRQPATRPAPGPDGSAFASNDPDENVPF